MLAAVGGKMSVEFSANQNQSFENSQSPEEIISPDSLELSKASEIENEK